MTKTLAIKTGAVTIQPAATNAELNAMLNSICSFQQQQYHYYCR
jgi:hypothetical protein